MKEVQSTPLKIVPRLTVIGREGMKKEYWKVILVATDQAEAVIHKDILIDIQSTIPMTFGGMMTIIGTTGLPMKKTEVTTDLLVQIETSGVVLILIIQGGTAIMKDLEKAGEMLVSIQGIDLTM